MSPEEKERKLEEALEDLLGSLGWATLPDREPIPSRLDIYMLRRSMRRAYTALGFTAKDLEGHVWS